jgi:glycosyltransferase involved in cell wall biosynthesis
MREPATEKVAIIMPAYNAALYIQQAIESVLAQSYTNWELWIVDDGSTDRTALQVQQFNDVRIHYFLTEHLGRPSQVRNLGSRLTKCPYLLFLDADDCLSPDALSQAMGLMLSRQNSRMVYGFLTAIDVGGLPVRSAGFKLVPDASAQTGFRLPEHYNHNPDKVALAQVCISTTFLIERTFFETLKGFDESLSASEDMDLFFRAFLTDWDGIFALPAYIVRYRKNLSSITRTAKNFERILDSQLRATQKLFNHSACPKEAILKSSEAFMRRYSYVSGLSLEQGNRVLALKFCLQACWHPEINLKAWLKHGLTLIPRALFLPSELDLYLKELAVQWRDGVWKNRQLSGKNAPEKIVFPETLSMGTGI